MSRPDGRWSAAGVFVLTVAQLATAAAFPELDQFAGKGFTARLVAYPVAMLVPVGVWWLVTGRSGAARPPAPWGAFAWIMLPFLVDVTGNTLDLYDRIWWWDDANHLVNWFFLNLGIGLLLALGASWRGWQLLAVVAGTGAILAIGWEVAEYYAFIRGGTELATAYTDTLGDEVLGTLGATGAGLVVARGRRRSAPNDAPAGGVTTS